jgi:hypothetical protein
VLATALRYLPIVVGLAAGLWYPVTFLRTARQAGEKGHDVDRAALVDAFLVSLVALLLAWLWVPWQLVPPALWAVPVGVDAYALLVSAAAWRDLRWAHGGKGGERTASTLVGAVAVAAIFYLVVR